MKESLNEWGVAIVIAMILMIPSIGLATGVDDVSRHPTKDVTIGWAALSSVDNTSSHQNTEGSGLTEHIQCTFTVVGTDTMTAWLQTSMADSAFVNATATPNVIRTSNIETLMMIDNAIGGSYWRWHGISGFDVTNTVTFSCDFWR